MLDAAIASGMLYDLVREADAALEDERLWSIWITGISPLSFEAWKSELAESQTVQRAIASVDTGDVIADSIDISSSMLAREVGTFERV